MSLHDFLYASGVTTNTWGFALVLFTFSVRMLALPLTWIQYSSTEKQKALQVRPGQPGCLRLFWWQPSHDMFKVACL